MSLDSALQTPFPESEQDKDTQILAQDYLYSSFDGPLSDPSTWSGTTHQDTPPDAPAPTLLEILQSVRISPSEYVEKPPVCLEIIGETGVGTIGTLGNFGMYIGKAKSRKTFFLTIAVSAAIKNGTILGVVRGNFPENQRTVLYFDTEQGKYHAHKSVQRICRLSGVENPEHLQAYGLRKFKPSERLEMIEAAIYNTPNLGLVVIDGIRDLITSINDEEQATDITTRLLRWSEELHVHIICVLHQNKNDTNARGHVGTEATNKAETVLSIEKSEHDKTISVVQAVHCRDKDFDSIGFEIDESGLPRVAGDWKVRTQKKAHTIGVDEVEEWRLYQLFTDAFAGSETLTYGDLVTKFKIAVKRQFKKDMGVNKIKEFIVVGRDEGWIVQDKPKAPYKLGEFGAPDESEATETAPAPGVDDSDEIGGIRFSPPPISPDEISDVTV
jgi:hypothetical protein